MTDVSKLFGLAKNHVTGGYSLTNPETPILAPGLLDATAGNLDPFTIGHHTRCAPWTTGNPLNVPIKGNLDLAIFQIRNENLVSSYQGHHFDTPASVAKFSEVAARKGAKVWKMGRTTGLTEGHIFGQTSRPIEVLTKDPDFKSPVHFDDILIIEDGLSGPFARPGDSGSLAVWKKNGAYEAIGIVFSVGTNHRHTYLLPMEEVLRAFNVGIVGNHNV